MRRTSVSTKKIITKMAVLASVTGASAIANDTALIHVAKSTVFACIWSMARIDELAIV